jgi:hypothetical protein
LFSFLLLVVWSLLFLVWLFVEDLGLMGRGNGAIISTFVPTVLSHSLVSNVIDLCPVGALVSKVGSGSYRSWEKESSYFLDVLDPFLKPVSIELCGNRIVDILPVTSSINSFITERSRLLWESLQSFRSGGPVISSSKDVSFSSTILLMNKFFLYFKNRPSLFFNSVFDFDFLDLKDSFVVSFLYGSFFGFQLNKPLIGSHFDSRNFLNKSFDHNFVHLVAGVSLEEEAPVLVPFLNRVSNTNSAPVYLMNSSVCSSFSNLRNVVHFSSSGGSCKKFLEGRSSHCSYLSFYKNKFNVFVNDLLFDVFSNVHSFTTNIFNISFIRNFGMLHKEEIGSVFTFHSLDSFIYKKNYLFIKFFCKTDNSFSKYNTLYSFDVHSELSNSISNLKIDVGLYSLFEKSGNFINVKGTLKHTNARIHCYIEKLFTNEFWLWKLFHFFFNSSISYNQYAWYDGAHLFRYFGSSVPFFKHTSLFSSYLLKLFGFFFFANSFFSFVWGICSSNIPTVSPITSSFLFVSNFRKYFFSPLDADVFSVWSVSLSKGSSITHHTSYSFF